MLTNSHTITHRSTRAHTYGGRDRQRQAEAGTEKAQKRHKHAHIGTEAQRHAQTDGKIDRGSLRPTTAISTSTVKSSPLSLEAMEDVEAGYDDSVLEARVRKSVKRSYDSSIYIS